MITAFLLGACLVQSTPADAVQVQEKRLHLDVFEDFARELVGDGWKLEMDRSIAGRSVVWYLGKPGDGLADFKRSCELLDLGCFVDDEKKKIFVNGPLAQAWPTYRQAILRTLEDFREDIVAMGKKSLAEVQESYYRGRQILDTEGLDDTAKAKAKRMVQTSLYMIDREDRVCAAQVFSMNPADIATRLEKSPTGLIRVGLSPAAQKEFDLLLEEGVSPLFDDDYISHIEDKAMQESMRMDNSIRAQEFKSCLAENPTVEVWISADYSGGIVAKLRFISDQSSSVFGASLLQGSRGMSGERGDILTFAELMKVLDPVLENPEKQLVPGSTTINSYAETIFDKGNSVSWLQPSLAPYFRMVSDEQYMEQFFFKKMDDNWLQLYQRRDRYPRFGEGWKDLFSWFDLARDGVSRSDVRAWVNTLTPEEMEQAGWPVDPMFFHGEGVNWLRDGLLVQAAYLEMKRLGVETEMEVPVSRLGSEAQRCVNAYLESVNVWANHPSLGRDFHRKQRGDYIFRVWLRDEGIEVELETSLMRNGSPVYLKATVPTQTKQL